MAMFQIADRFGRRPHPKLVVVAGGRKIIPQVMGIPDRVVAFSLRNEGRGLALFPCLRIRNAAKTPFPFIIQSNGYKTDQPAWPVRGHDGWQSVRGGANDVVYPGETVDVCTALQAGQREDPASERFVFRPVTLIVEAMCEGMPPHSETFTFEAEEFQNFASPR